MALTHEATSGYVPLQQIPYRSHDLTAKAVLENTHPGDRVFEAGVSTGYFARILKESGLHVDGVEIDPAAAEQAREVCDLVVTGDLERMDLSPFGNDYAVLLFGDTLEHLADPVKVLKRLRPRLHDRGVLVLSIPNVANWTIRLGLLLGRFRYTDRGILDSTHLRFYTMTTLTEMLREAGFEPRRITGSIPVPGVRARWLCWLVHRLGNLWPSLFAYQFVAVADPIKESR